MRVLTVFVCLLFVTTASFAGAAFGLRIGLNSANATHGPNEDYKSDPKPGLIISGSLETALNSKANRTLRVDFGFVQKGWKDAGEIDNLQISGEANIDEFVITPGFIFRLSDGSTIPYVLLGGSVGFTLAADATVRVNNLSATAEIPDWNDTNVGLDFGFGLLFPSGKGEFVTELRLDLGLTDMYTGPFDYEVRTNGVQLIFGYNFSVPS